MTGRNILWFQHFNGESGENIDTTELDEVVTLDREPTINDFTDDITFIRYNGLIYAKKDNEVVTIWQTLPHNHDDRYFTKQETNNKLNDKADINHNHDDEYVTDVYMGKGVFSVVKNGNTSNYTIPNIYNQDGSIHQNRTINMGSSYVSFSGNEFATVEAKSYSDNGGVFRVSNGSQNYQMGITADGYYIYSSEEDKNIFEYDVQNDRVLLNGEEIKKVVPVYCVVCTDASNINTDQVYPFNTIIYDNYNAFDTNNHKFVAPKQGTYRVAFGGFIGDYSNNKCFRWVLRKNGNNTYGIIWLDTRSTRYGDNGWMETVVNLNAGDELDIYFYKVTENTTDYGTRDYSRFIIEELVGGLK